MSPERRKRRKHVDEAKHLHFEGLVAHGESHHLLVETGLGKNGFRVLIDQVENLLAATFDGGLESAHEPINKAGRGFRQRGWFPIAPTRSKTSSVANQG